jgi:hypothetical protein
VGLATGTAVYLAALPAPIIPKITSSSSMFRGTVSSNIWWHMPLFLIYYFHRLILTRVHFTYSNFAWGLHGGVDVMWCGGLFVLDLH